MMGYGEVMAPFDGVVTHKWVDVGDLASPGKPLISIEDPTALQLEADVPQSIAAHVQRGDRLAVRVDGVDEDLFGNVTEIAPAADSVSRTLQVKVGLTEKAGLRSGQFARLLIPTGESEFLSIPVGAIVQRGQMEIAFVVTANRAHLHLIKTGKRIGDGMEVLSGIQAGDTVVVESAGQLTDGQPVDVR
jgi:RND family efflux transporter MFP subunit